LRPELTSPRAAADATQKASQLITGKSSPLQLPPPRLPRQLLYRLPKVRTTLQQSGSNPAGTNRVVLPTEHSSARVDPILSDEQADLFSLP